MGGLVAYASSDEEDEAQEAALPLKTETSNNGTTPAHHSETNDAKPSQPPPTTTEPETQSLLDNFTIGPVQQHSVPLGPSLPPMDPQSLQGSSQDGDLSQPPASPYTASRALLRDLTLPPVPNFDIPASPPGSPPPALEAKLSQFLDLKKKGVHFNAKLTQSAALRNPSLTDKLMAFVDLDGRAGYATTLPPDLWDPVSEEVLPEWATRAALRQSQERVRAERAGLRKGGGPVEFVPAAIAGGGNVGSSAATEKSELLRAGKRKAGAF
ncbi:Meiotically up-regulated protein [Colletotrichum tanaceti]|uniref:Meiotically up-regulated protein n=1 Tax=Colletotrichum tanaceti TaxID=1306861 RepID=A0A4U6XGS5_9PEZI|nr:Meiotically up-regulated protein [Colletotrichum tanaceti]TKW53207.1 Meiotically up-regulated protein [Colletotrichum tanaceti]